MGGMFVFASSRERKVWRTWYSGAMPSRTAFAMLGFRPQRMKGMGGVAMVLLFRCGSWRCEGYVKWYGGGSAR